MANFEVPTRDQVSEDNQQIFDKLKGNLGFVPNLYAYYAKSSTALSDYLTFQGRKTTLSTKEKEVVSLVTSQINGCKYCQSAHTVLGKMNGFTEEQIIELRKGTASFDTKLDALVKFAGAVVEKKGQVSNNIKEDFFAVGYSEENMIDVVVAIGDKIISNYIHNLADFAIDFPVAPEV